MSTSTPIFESQDKDALLMAWKSWHSAPSPKMLTAVLHEARPVLSSVLKSYTGGKSDPVLDLEAKRLAVQAFQSYDPLKGAKLKTHLFHQLAPLRQVVHQRANVLKMPRLAWADLQNLRTAERDLLDQSGNEPGAAALSERTGLSLKRIEFLRQFGRAGIPESALANREPGEVFRVSDSTETSWWAEAVWVGLPEVKQKIYDWKLGAHGAEKLSAKEIAKRLGVSAARVSQHTTRIIEQMQAVVN